MKGSTRGFESVRLLLLRVYVNLAPACQEEYIYIMHINLVVVGSMHNE